MCSGGMSTIYDVDVLHSSSGKYAITALGVYGDVLFVGCDDGCLRLLDNRLRTAGTSRRLLVRAS